ncbi:MAG: hypothetical protein LBE36_02855 [Flavobacteriaceae bacterium]|jgi:hypothetical protein|nr:hypothetical protein [Flavobacteriaceae bacterium]
MNQVLFLPQIQQYFKELVLILYEKEYFGFLESAKKYVQELYDDITANLPQKTKKRAPKYFDSYGKNMYYSTFQKNKRTSWYIFFRIYKENGKKIYQVRYISNNYVIAHHL